MFQKLNLAPPTKFNPDKHTLEAYAKKAKSYLPLADRDIYRAMNWADDRQTPITPQQIEIHREDTIN
eukprot:3684730-Lingulodinium_polyedra.AAC.1